MIFRYLREVTITWAAQRRNLNLYSGAVAFDAFVAGGVFIYEND